MMMVLLVAVVVGIVFAIAHVLGGMSYKLEAFELPHSIEYYVAGSFIAGILVGAAYIYDTAFGTLMAFVFVGSYALGKYTAQKEDEHDK